MDGGSYVEMICEGLIGSRSDFTISVAGRDGDRHKLTVAPQAISYDSTAMVEKSAPDREGWATLHVIEARGGGRVEFGPRIAWPDGDTAARRTAKTVALASAAVAESEGGMD